MLVGDMRVEFDTFAVDLWFVAIGLLIVSLFIAWRRTHSYSYLICFFIFGAYQLLAIAKIFFPIHISGGFADAMRREREFASFINLIPFYFGPFGTLESSLVSLLQNIILTMPFGFGINFVAPVKGKHFLWLPLAVGLGIEALQLTISLLLGYAYRFIDINDVLMNALGVVIGYGMFRVFAALYLWGTRHFNLQLSGFFAYVYDVAARATGSRARAS
jgi:glycopeptide antibiotics resistance protein